MTHAPLAKSCPLTRTATLVLPGRNEFGLKLNIRGIIDSAVGKEPEPKKPAKAKSKEVYRGKLARGKSKSKGSKAKGKKSRR